MEVPHGISWKSQMHSLASGHQTELENSTELQVQQIGLDPAALVAPDIPSDEGLSLCQFLHL